MQGGECALPIPRFPTGIMRGRFHPGNGQLYTCGLFAWAGDQTEPGGFYRVRATGKPMFLPIGLSAHEDGMLIRFTAALDPQAASEVSRYSSRSWTIKRTADYGSDHYHERSLKITAASLLADGHTVFLKIPDIHPTRCMEITYRIRGRGGETVEGVIHNTIHNLGAAVASTGSPAPKEAFAPH